MEQESIEDIIMFWLAQNDGIIGDWSKGERKQRILELIDLFVWHGYSKEEIKSTKNKIIHHCHNPNYKGRGLKNWISLIEKDVGLAMAEKFPISTPDTSIKTEFKKVESTPRPENYTPKTIEEEVALEHLAETEPVHEKEKEHSGYLTPPMDQSVIDSMPKPDVVYDEEFRKLMGFDK